MTRIFEPGVQDVEVLRNYQGTPVVGLYFGHHKGSIVAMCRTCEFNLDIGVYPTIVEITKASRAHLDRAVGSSCTHPSVYAPFKEEF